MEIRKWNGRRKKKRKKNKEKNKEKKRGNKERKKNLESLYNMPHILRNL